MKKFRIDYAVNEGFGEPLHFCKVITCEDEVTEHDIVEDILKEHEGMQIVSFNLKRED